MYARVHRIPTASPDDTEGLRGFATASLKAALAELSGRPPSEVEQAVVLVMSGGTEGGLSPHLLVFEALEGGPRPRPGVKALALGCTRTRTFAPHEIGRAPQALATAEAVRTAMQRAGIASAEDVHYVQVKCPLLTRARIVEAGKAGQTVAAENTYASMGTSRGASALGVALALGEIDALDEDAIGRDTGLFSSRASASAGVELLDNQILVVGNSAAWGGDLLAAHDVMADAIDVPAVLRALAGAGIAPTVPLAAEAADRLVAVLAKAEAAQSGLIRGARHTMLDDSDIQASRHARALVGGVLAGITGTTLLFVSGGAEHQGPDGGGPVAVIARRQD